MNEFILWTIIIFCIASPIMALYGIIRFIVWLVKKIKGDESSFTEAEAVCKTETLRKERKKLNSSAVLLLIGTAFVILSGLALTAANWVNTTPIERTLIILGGTAVSFIASILLRSLAKLENTSAAFYIVGTFFSATTFLTAGYYGLFGDWFSAYGEGSMLMYAVCFGIAAIILINAGRIFNRSVFDYVGLSAVYIALIFVAEQITESFGDFAVLLIAFQALITASVHILNIDKSLPFAKAFRHTSDFASVLFAFISLCHPLSSFYDTDYAAYLIIVLVIIQLTTYGIIKNNKTLTAASCIVELFLALVICSDLSLKDNYASALFSSMTMLIYIANRFIPKKKTTFGETASLTGMIISSMISVFCLDINTIGLSLFIPIICCLTVYSYAYHSNKIIQAVFGIISPVLPLIIAGMVNNELYNSFLHNNSDYSDKITSIVLSILSVVLTLITAFLNSKQEIVLRNIHTRKSNTVLYSNMFVSAFVIFMTIPETDNYFLLLAAALIHFFVSEKLPVNISSAGSVISIFTIIGNLLDNINSDNDAVLTITALFMFAVLIFISRFMYRESLFIKNENECKADYIQLLLWVAVIIFGINCDTTGFVNQLMTAVFIANFIRKNTKAETARILISISALSADYALITRPVLLPENILISSKITLGLIALLGICYRYIWRANEKASRTASTLLYITAFSGLILDAMHFSNGGNTIFVLCVTSAILIISFMSKSKTWFSVSSIALMVMTLWASRKYLETLSWWIYLFIAGIIFIILAAVNEYFKTKGENVKTGFSKAFSDWKW